MPSGNRVEELERQVAELEATVEGLTEELVEAHDRIRQLEAALGDDVDVNLTAKMETEEPEATYESTDHAEVERAPDDHGIEAAEDNERVEIMGLEQEVSVEDDESETVETGADPEEVAQAAAEAAKKGEDQSADEGESDDIIVA